ncbi:hypothetical protein [Lusitaniella coriacea]|uniref:hypothetical protein n=1 Tax=Lusitaniella coriacea TaxID=1983105 RepID=UPI001D14B01A|nr:hypothetical protein [Lusitaniella coriacea]
MSLAARIKALKFAIARLIMMRKTLIFLPAFLSAIPLIATESLAQTSVSVVANPDILQEQLSDALALGDAIEPQIPLQMSGIDNTEVRDVQTVESLYGEIHREARFLTFSPPTRILNPISARGWVYLGFLRIISAAPIREPIWVLQ